MYNDLLLATDVSQVSALCLLDLTAAFDTVDHQLLLHRLERQFGLCGVVLAWFSSYLTDRSFRVLYNGGMSSVVFVLCSVPQGSVLGPRLFALYTADLEEVTDQHKVNLHSYADDSQWAGSKHNISVLRGHAPALQLGSDTVTASDHVRVLRVTISSDLSLEKHVSKTCAACFYCLRQLRRKSLDDESAATLVHAFVTSRVDYCNALYAGSPKTITDNLQRVPNVAARVVSDTRKFDRGLSAILHGELH